MQCKVEIMKFPISKLEDFTHTHLELKLLDKHII